MTVRREPWGTTRDGEPVELFTLENGALRARFTNFGATLVSLEVPDRHGERADVVLGFDTLAEYESARNPYFGGIVGRCANRIAGARFTLGGREVRLTPNEGRHHLHGGARGYDRRNWSVEFAFDAKLGLRLQSPDGEEGYPGALDVVGAYELGLGRGRSWLELLLMARANAPTAINLTQHAYFNLAGGGTILDHELEVFASRYVVVDDELLPTGELASVAGTPFDFRARRAIGARIAELSDSPARGYDLCYALDVPAVPPLPPEPPSATELLQRPRPFFTAARLSDPHSGRTLEVHTDAPGLQLYTGNRLDGVVGKRGVVHPRFAGLCLETQRFPDAVHHAHFPSVLLRPDEAYRSRNVWRFSAE